MCITKQPMTMPHLTVLFLPIVVATSGPPSSPIELYRQVIWPWTMDHNFHQRIQHPLWSFFICRIMHLQVGSKQSSNPFRPSRQVDLCVLFMRSSSIPSSAVLSGTSLATSVEQWRNPRCRPNTLVIPGNCHIGWWTWTSSKDFRTNQWTSISMSSSFSHTISWCKKKRGIEGRAQVASGANKFQWKK